MKQLLHNKYFHTNLINSNDNDDDINTDNIDDTNSDTNTYATCIVCRCHIFNMVDIEKHDPR